MSVAIIAARKNSRGVPGKNTRIVAGLKLWQWSLRAAMRARTVKRIIVTTDDSSILLDAHDAGCEVVHRPDALATDEASMDEALLHAIDYREVMDDSVVVVLQPTVPVRRENLVDDCVKTFIAFPEARSLLTCSPLHFVWDGGSGRLLNSPRVNRQAMTSKLYHEDGSVFCTRALDFREFRSRIVEPVVLVENAWSPDIDTEEDLAVAEFLLLRRQEGAA